MNPFYVRYLGYGTKKVNKGKQYLVVHIQPSGWAVLVDLATNKFNFAKGVFKDYTFDGLASPEDDLSEE